MKTPHLTRRDFLRSAATLAAATAIPTVITTPLFGDAAPSNRITVGCIGMGNMGSFHLQGLLEMDPCQVVALCDVDSMKLESARELAGLEPRDTYRDFREMLERDDIDAINIATPDHWHVPMAMAAVRAGKAVYVQKPVSLTILEGRRLCDLCNDVNAIVQVGSQQRSSRNFRHAAELVRNGYLGEIKRIDVGLEEPYTFDAGTSPPEPEPDHLDYQKWLGPAPFKPYSFQRVVHFRSSYDYSGGYFSDWGAHHFDIVQWALGMDNSGPEFVEGTGTFHTEGSFNVPMSYDVTYQYPGNIPMRATEKLPQGIRFEGTEGWLFVNRERFDASRKSLLNLRLAPSDVRLIESNEHTLNLFDAMRGRSPIVAPPEVGHRTATVCHIGNIALRLGRPLQWDPVKETFVNDEAANRLRDGADRQDWRVG